MGPTPFLGSLTGNSSTFSLLAFTLGSQCFCMSQFQDYYSFKPNDLEAKISLSLLEDLLPGFSFWVDYPPHPVN